MMDCLLRIWPICQGLVAFLLMCCLTSGQNVQPSTLKEEENAIHADHGFHSINDFSMLTLNNKSADENGSKGSSDFDHSGYVLYCPCMGE